MSAKFTLVSSANTGDRLAPVIKAARQLSDGTLIALYSDGAASPVVKLGYSSDHSTWVDIATITTNTAGGFYCPQTGLNTLTLDRDASDNIYVFGWDNLRDLVRGKAFTKGAGYTWTAQTSLVGTTSNANASGGEFAGAWCNTTGGTGGHGHLICAGRHTGSGNQLAWTLDAGALLAGSGTLEVNAYNGTGIASHNNGTMSGLSAVWDFSPDGFGATSGLWISQQSNNSPNFQLAVGKWSVSAAGVITDGYITQYGPFLDWQSKRAQVVRYASNRWAIFVPDSGGAKITVGLFSSTAKLAGFTTYGTITNWPSIATGLSWDVIVDNVVANQLWLYGWSSATATTMLRLALTTTGDAITWAATTTTDDTSVGSGTNSTLRTVKFPTGTSVDWQTFNANGGTDALLGDFSVFATAPNAPTLTSPATGAYLDVSGGATFVRTYNSTDAANENAYALRAKQAGGSYLYFNATTGLWQVSIVWNPVSTVPGGSASVTVPASATIANGFTLNWSMASQEATSNLQGPFASDSTIVMQVSPTVIVTAPSGTVTGSLTPHMTWTTTPAAGATQTSYRVLIYTPAQYGGGGFSPGVTAAYYDTGVVASPNQFFDVPTAANLVAGVAYRFYVQVVETGGESSSWQFSGATMSVDPPADPTLTAVPGVDGTTGAPRMAVTVSGRDNLLTLNQASLETDTTGWAQGANTTIARDTAQHIDGVASLKLTATAGGSVSASTPTGLSGVAVNPSQQVTIAGNFRANTTGRTTTVQALWWKSDGTASSHPSDTSVGVADASGAWQAGLGSALTVVAPADAAFMSLVVQVAGCGAGEIHWVDNMIVAPGTVTTWTRGGLSGLTTYLVQFSDDNATWTTMRTSGGAATFPGQSSTVYDYEVPPGSTRYYRAQIQANVGGGSTILSGFATANAVGSTPSQWVISDPTDATSAVLFHSNGDPGRTLVTRATMHFPFGRSRGVRVSDGSKGWGGTLPARTTSSTTQKALEALLARGVVLLIQSPEGAGRQWYANISSDPRLTQLGTTLGSTVLSGVAGRGTTKMPHTDNSISYDEAERP